MVFIVPLNNNKQQINFFFSFLKEVSVLAEHSIQPSDAAVSSTI